VSGADIWLDTTYGTVDSVAPDGTVTLSFSRRGYVTRRYLTPAEVERALELCDLRPLSRSVPK